MNGELQRIAEGRGMEWNWWDIALLAAAAYVAVVSLVRLMARRRDKLLDDLSGDLKQQKRKAG